MLQIHAGGGVPAGFTPKDFTVLWVDGVAHAYFILNNLPLRFANTSAAQHMNERRFGHAVSRDLARWTFVDSAFSAGGSNWDRDHVWAPHLIEDQGVFWLFYTGVRDSVGPNGWEPAAQSIGAAWSTDLANWHYSGAPLLEAGAAIPWADRAAGGVRDPFVMRMDSSVPGSAEPRGWLLYYHVKPASAPPGAWNPWSSVVGVAQAAAGGLGAWSDLGPMWSTYRSYQSEPGTNKVESPHLFRWGMTWYLFFTGESGLQLLTGANPVGSVGSPDSCWTWRGTPGELNPGEYASESFLVAWPDGSSERYFATLQSYPQYQHVINLRVFQPLGNALLFDPLELASLVASKGHASEGDSLALIVSARDPVSASTFQTTLTRAAPVEVFEVDTLGGQASMQAIPPEDAGLPSVIHATTNYLAGDRDETVPFVARWFADDDDTPDRDEFVVSVRGERSPLFTVARAGVTVGVTPRPAAPAARAVRLRAIGRTPVGGGEALLLELAAPARARLDVFDAAGRRIRRLADRDLPAGATIVRWDGRDESGAPAASGLYLVRATTTLGAATARLLRIR